MKHELKTSQQGQTAVGREFPANPNIVVYHFADRLTNEIVESFRAGEPSQERAAGEGRAWAARLLDEPRVRDISINAYRVRIAKAKAADWEGLVARTDAVVRAAFGIDQVVGIEPVDRIRHFDWHGAPFAPKLVFEGARRAAEHPVGGPLFAIPGVAEVVLDGARVAVRRAPMHAWLDIGAAVEARLLQRDGSPARPPDAVSRP